MGCQMPERAAVLLDGGFVKKKLMGQTHKFPTPAEIVHVVTDVMAKPRLKDADRLERLQERVITLERAGWP